MTEFKRGGVTPKAAPARLKAGEQVIARKDFPSLHRFIPAESGPGCRICGRKEESHQ